MGVKKVLVIGGGPGGYVAAIRAAQLGAEVVLIEKQSIGGTCLNVGCIPTKCLLHSAQLAEDLKKSSELGIKVSGVEVDFAQIMAHKNSITKTLCMGVSGLLKMNRVQMVKGTAVFTAPKIVAVTRPDGIQETMTADAVIIAVGSVNAVPPIPGMKGHPNCIDSTGALVLERLPKSMAIIGGGVIGLELACAYGAFGTQVTVIESMPSVLPMLDQELVKIGLKHMKKMGITICLECSVQSVEESVAGARVVCRDKAGEMLCFEAEKVLAAVGRRANTAELGLEAGGLEHKNGAILVNDRMETSVAGVYAIGDCVYGRGQLAHTASAMGETAAENIMGQACTYDAKTSPACVYMMPEAASVGMTEEEAKSKGIVYRVGRFPLMANGKALILNGGEGLAKVVVDATSNTVLGMHLIGPRATDLIAEGALAIRMGCGAEDLINTIHSHPTISETVREAALNAEKRAIHIRN